MRKTSILLTQREAQEIIRMLMNYGMVLEALQGTRGIPTGVLEFINKRRSMDFQNLDIRMNKLMVKMLTAINADLDKKEEKKGKSGPPS
jgi:hypothetical protein